MRTASVIFIAVGVFILGSGVIYWFTSYEPSGTVLLGAAIGFAVIPGLFLWRHSSTALNREALSREDGAGPVGAFPEASVWPFVMAGGAAMAGVGLVFGLWTALPGAILLGIGFVGGVLQSS